MLKTDSGPSGQIARGRRFCPKKKIIAKEPKLGNLEKWR
jgi:hypothetical protein